MLNPTRALGVRASGEASSAKRLPLVVALLAFGTALAPGSLGCAAPHVSHRTSGTTTNIGPGPGKAASREGNDSLTVRVWPNRAAVWNAITLSVLRRGDALTGASVTLSFTMPAMAMGPETFRLVERRPGEYSYLGPALLMPGRWDLRFTITASHNRPFASLVVDHLGP